MADCIPLSRAWLCPDCESICDSAEQCACGNRLGLLSLSAVLNDKSVVQRSPIAPASEQSNLPAPL